MWQGRGALDRDSRRPATGSWVGDAVQLVSRRARSGTLRAADRSPLAEAPVHRERRDSVSLRRTSPEFSMGQVTGQRGLTAIERAGGVEEATYAPKVGHRYRGAKGRVAETYRQLADGPMTGSDLFADLEARNWLLPVARRKYRPGKFRAHLWWMVGEGVCTC